jgi:surface polysaccharide O-acyltransferase-like enzyme
MEQASGEPAKSNPDISVDLVRTVAIIAVIFLHATADLTIPGMDQFEIIRWTTNDVYQSIGRICIPLFVMLSGALLLQPEKHDTLSSFFKKRWARIGLPWIFWGATYFAWDFLVINKPFTSDAVVQGILTGPYYNFWYLYMLLGLYILTPFLRIMLPKITHAALKRYLVMWFIFAAVIPFIVILAGSGSFSADVANVIWVIYLLFGLTGYFVLGTFLAKVKIRRLLLSILAVIGLALSAVSIYIIQSPIGGNRDFFAFTVYFGPWTILTSVAIFLLLNTIKTPTQPSGLSAGRKFVKVISQNTLPLALFHLMVLESLQRGYFGFAINGNTINTIIGVPLITAMTLFISLGIILLLKKIPCLDRLIG